MVNKSAGVPELNPPFSQNWQYTGRFNTPTQKGYILCLPQEGMGSSNLGPQPGKIHFQFNPQNVGISHMMNPNAATGEAALPDYTVDMGTIFGTYGSTQVTLQFDRTFEVNNGSTTGVYDDVNAFYKMLGIINSDGNPFNPMYMVQIQVFFGSVVNVAGYVSDFSVNYTAWSKTLVPMRVDVSLGMSLMALQNSDTFDGTYAATIGASGSGTWQSSGAASGTVKGNSLTTTNTPSTGVPQGPLGVNGLTGFFGVGGGQQ